MNFHLSVRGDAFHWSARAAELNRNVDIFQPVRLRREVAHEPVVRIVERLLHLRGRLGSRRGRLEGSVADSRRLLGRAGRSRFHRVLVQLELVAPSCSEQISGDPDILLLEAEIRVARVYREIDRRFHNMVLELTARLGMHVACVSVGVPGTGHLRPGRQDNDDLAGLVLHVHVALCDEHQFRRNMLPEDPALNGCYRQVVALVVVEGSPVDEHERAEGEEAHDGCHGRVLQPRECEGCQDQAEQDQSQRAERGYKEEIYDHEHPAGEHPEEYLTHCCAGLRGNLEDRDEKRRVHKDAAGTIHQTRDHQGPEDPDNQHHRAEWTGDVGDQRHNGGEDQELAEAEQEGILDNPPRVIHDPEELEEQGLPPTGVTRGGSNRSREDAPPKIGGEPRDCGSGSAEPLAPGVAPAPTTATGSDSATSEHALSDDRADREQEC